LRIIILLCDVTFRTIKFTEKVEAELRNIGMKVYSCVRTFTGSATKLKTGKYCSQNSAISCER